MEYIFPTVDLLDPIMEKKNNDSYLCEMAKKLVAVLRSFDIDCSICNMSSGPSISRFNITLAPGASIRKLINIEEDLEFRLGISKVRLDYPIPGELSIGVEIINEKRNLVSLRETVGSPEFNGVDSQTIFAVGKGIDGKVIVSDISNMGHILMVGGTGSGKTVCIDSIIMSMLFKASPDDVKFVLIDPRVVNLSGYNGIPHLFTPVITSPKQAIETLVWATEEMTSRYKTFTEAGVRSITEYNKKISYNFLNGEDAKKQRLPRIIIIIDEFFDLMMIAPNEVEDSVCKLAQLGRQMGIYLIISTQSHSANILTGLIRANMMDNLIAFASDSCTASGTILGINGTEKLAEMGDMLFLSHQNEKPVRVQAPYTSDREINAVCDFIKRNNRAPGYC